MQGKTRQSRPRAGTAAELGAHDFVFLTVKAQILPQLAPTLAAPDRTFHVVVSGTNGIPWWFFQDFGGELNNVRLESVDPGGFQERSVSAAAHVGIRGACLGTSAGPRTRRRLSPSIGCCSASRAVKFRRGLNPCVAALRDGGINAQASSRIRRDVWTKLWGNMTINPLSALTRSGAATLLGSTEVRELCVQ